MALTPRLELRQSQSLVMTPQLQQAIKLLQLSSLDLSAYVEQEIERNPLLEHDEGQDTAETENQPEDRDGEAGKTETDSLDAIDFSDDEPSAVPSDSAMDVDYDNVWNNDAPGDSPMADSDEGLRANAFEDWGSGGGHAFSGDGADLEQTLSGEETLRDHLNDQLTLSTEDPVDRIIGAYLIDSLDEAGYLTIDLDQVADTLGCDLARVEAALERAQHFSPTGVFARSLAECLALQLRDRDRLDPAMQALLDNLDQLARHDVEALCRLCGVDAEDVADMAAEIRSLNPKPALAFDHAMAQPVTPDVLMRPRTGGGWIIELNSETLPRVLVNNRYYTHITNKVRNRDDRQYVNECLQSANWLVKSLHQRATTILKVATEIVRQQDGFFVDGVRGLRPLVLRDIAQEIEMHESTVSRVTSNKYMATPRGIFELKYFFTTAIGSSSGGESHSAESVRHRIKTLVDAESPKAILSDDKIVKILKDDGVDIARRTVAKYRDALHIPSSVQRRREKNSSL
jgi:RNA polymerase sigma-54 factor